MAWAPLPAGRRPSPSGAEARGELVPFHAFVGNRWTSRFPQPPMLQVLGPGARHAAPEGHRRHAELVTHVFRTLDWPLEDFVGCRCDEEHPVWRGGYCMSCDFSDETPD